MSQGTPPETSSSPPPDASASPGPPRRGRRAWRGRLLAFVLGLLAILLLLEGGLRLLGRQLHRRADGAVSAAAGASGSRTILCLGDSYTAGLGARENNGYPEQLQRIIRQRHQGLDTRVINAGLVGCNSADIRSKLDAYLRAVRPEVLVLLVGTNNFGSVRGYFLHSRKPGLWTSALEALHDLRVVRLLRRLYGDVRTEAARREEQHLGDRLIEIGKGTSVDLNDRKHRISARERRELARIRSTHPRLPDTIQSYQNLWDYHRARADYAEAARWTQKGIPFYPTITTHIQLVDLYMTIGDQPEQVDRWMRRLAASHHDRREAVSFDYTWYLSTCIVLKRYAECSGYFKKASRHLPFLADFAGALERRRQLDDAGWKQRVLQWVGEDLTWIHGRCQEQGTRLVLQSYPPITPNSHQLLGLFRRTARQQGLPLVDNYALFKRDLQWRKPDELFMEDGHCNDAGYGLMAKNVYQTLLSAGLLSAPPAGAQGSAPRRCRTTVGQSGSGAPGSPLTNAATAWQPPLHSSR